MSKVICEICGTTYPDTENECPVCGFEKPETAEFAPEDTAAAAAVASGHVKGGRFSKANVSKKHAAAAAPAKAPAKKKKNKKRGNSDTGLIIAIIVLLLAIIATTAYIYFNYFAPQEAPEGTNPPVATTTEPVKQTLPPQTQPTTEAPDLSCTGLTLQDSGDNIFMNQIGSHWQLSVIPTPANTTDEITYASADESVATVSEDGKVTAVATGETVITITCGSVSIECKVVCQLPEEAEPQETEPQETEPEETEPEETKPQETSDFKFRKEDITFDGKGQTYTLYDGEIDVTKIVWTVGNSSVATVKDGVVKAVGPGRTTVYGEYNGVKLSCIVRCDF